MKRFAVVPIVLALLLAPVLALSALANLALTQISSDPYTNTTSQHATEVEPDTFAFGTTWVSTFQVGRFFDGGASNIGFATSTNSGSFFTLGFLPGTTPFTTPPGIYARVSDASVAFDARHGVWVTSYLGLFPNNNTSQVDVVVSRSTDDGLTWSDPIVVNNSGDFNDKNWTACDNTSSSPFYGRCYTEFDDNSHLDLLLMSTSSDGESTWGPALPTQNKFHGIGGQPVVQPNGRVVVPFVGFTLGPSNSGALGPNGAGLFIGAFSSTDGGVSWGPARIVSAIQFHTPAGGIRAGIPLPSAGVDASGKVYVVWSDCRFEPGCIASDLLLVTSTDGVQWSRAARIPLDPIGSGVDHFIPGLAVDSSARLGLTFYYYPQANCTFATCQLNVGGSSSSDAGAHWQPRLAVSGPMALEWLPNTNQGRMVGDYISTSFVSSKAVPAFAVAAAPDGSNPDCQQATPNCNQPMFSIRGGLPIVSGGLATTDMANNATGVTPGSNSLTAQ